MMKPLRFFMLCLFLAGFKLALGQDELWIPYRKGAVWGFSDIQGKIKIEPAYQRTYFFTEDQLARIKQNNRYGYIDRQGRVVIQPKFTEASDFAMGLARVKENGKAFCIATDGNAEECPDDNTHDYFIEDAPKPYQSDHHFIFHHENGKIKVSISAPHDTVLGFFDEATLTEIESFPKKSYFLIVRQDKLMSAFNEWGVLILPFTYPSISIVSMHAIKAFNGKKWGLVGFNQNEILPFIYDDIIAVPEPDYHEGQITKGRQYIVRLNNRFGVVDEHNKPVLKPVYEDILYPRQCNCVGEYVIKQNGLYGVADHKGRIVVKPKYAAIEPFASSAYTLVVTSSNKKEGYINRKGLEFFSD